MIEKLYVGNLLFEVSDQELRELVESAGCEVIEARIFYDDSTGHSRGFGTVRIPKANEAAALSLNEFEYRGRRIIVRPWRESARFAQPHWKNKI